MAAVTLFGVYIKPLFFSIEFHYLPTLGESAFPFHKNNLNKMAAVLRIPEKSGSEILLSYKFTKSNAKLETGAELVLEVSERERETEFTAVDKKCEVLTHTHTHTNI